MKAPVEIRRVILSFLYIELAIAVGALVGVGILDWNWVFGLGVFNVKAAVVVGIFPALILAMIVGSRERASVRGMTVMFCLMAFVVSVGFSLVLGSAMVGI